MSKRYELTDDEWNRIANLLPPENTGKRGRPGKDNRSMLDAMVWIARSGAPWRDLPERYGPWESVYGRFRKWLEDAYLDNIFRVLSLDARLLKKSPFFKLFRHISQNKSRFIIYIDFKKRSYHVLGRFKNLKIQPSCAILLFILVFQQPPLMQNWRNSAWMAPLFKRTSIAQVQKKGAKTPDRAQPWRSKHQNPCGGGCLWLSREYPTE